MEAQLQRPHRSRAAWTNQKPQPRAFLECFLKKKSVGSSVRKRITPCSFPYAARTSSESDYHYTLGGEKLYQLIDLALPMCLVMIVHRPRILKIFEGEWVAELLVLGAFQNTQHSSQCRIGIWPRPLVSFAQTFRLTLASRSLVATGCRQPTCVIQTLISSRATNNAARW